MAEAGTPGFEASSWTGLMGPAGMPKSVIAKLSEISNRILKEPELADKLFKQGNDVVGSSPEQFAATVAAEIVQWKTAWLPNVPSEGPRALSTRPPFLRLHGLNHRHDVALGVLEPRGLGAAASLDAVIVDIGHIVLLELHAARLQLRDFLCDVLDLPECLARLRGAGVRRGIEEAGRALGELVHDAARYLFLGLEAKLAFVELARPVDVFGRDV